jgi:glutathione S-transferase
MLLYTYDAAPNPRRVNLFIRFKGIELPTRQINLRESEQLCEEFRAINPRCLVPALRLDDGTVICDGIAICWYLESLYPAKPLLGTNPLQQAQILSWDQRVFTDGILSAAEVLRNTHKAFKDRALPGPEPLAQIPELAARGRLRLKRFWHDLDAHMEGRDFIVGGALSMADIDAFCVIDFAAWTKEAIPESCTNVQSWSGRVRNGLGL